LGYLCERLFFYAATSPNRRDWELCSWLQVANTFRDGGGFALGAVVDGQIISGTKKVLRHPLPHHAEADEGDSSFQYVYPPAVVC